jgi:hypothetical protein
MDSTKNAPGHVTVNLCFASGRIFGLRSALRSGRGVKCLCTIFLAPVGPVRILEKVCRDMLRRTYVFHLVGSCGSCNALWCIRGVKHRRTIFLLRVGPV